ncbi:hypothetical protein OTB20_08515 [Streptomyces sp. H27-H1]|uniref:hypothetical protein n=1 Tax=Streptomyces sp. H27-H1 TaxID=2996461 RepID=UPI00226D55BA|nr:hypothetical protein [Streptomyces sp. H27-H1]MCY0926248.1 hypothetical protein [Streptomyces sp. H27-H1]
MATDLLCVGLCRRRKPRTAFRETPWHGRAADCLSCEGRGWKGEREERVYWELEQAREKLRAKSRYIRALQLRALIRSMPTSADVVQAARDPWERAVEHKVRMWSMATAEALREAENDV